MSGRLETESVNLKLAELRFGRLSNRLPPTALLDPIQRSALSILSVRIRELDAQISALYVEILHLHALEVAIDSQQLNLREKSQRILTDTEYAVRFHPFHILLYSSRPMSFSCPIPLFVVLFPTLPFLEHLGQLILPPSHLLDYYPRSLQFLHWRFLDGYRDTVWMTNTPQFRYFFHNVL